MSQGTEGKTWLKVCGVQFPENARTIAQFDVDAIGINRYSESSRYCSIEQARSIRNAVRHEDPSVKLVGLYVNEGVKAIKQDLNKFEFDILQLHGDEQPETIDELSEVRPTIKAIRLPPDGNVGWETYDSWRLLFDHYDPKEYGGTGEKPPWDRLVRMDLPERWILAGGLTVKNVQKAIRRLNPWGVDVCSGVETADGLKHPEKVEDFVRQVRTAGEVNS